MVTVTGFIMVIIFAMYINIESLCCTPKSNLNCMSIILQFLNVKSPHTLTSKKGHSPQSYDLYLTILSVTDFIWIP